MTELGPIIDLGDEFRGTVQAAIDQYKAVSSGGKIAHTNPRPNTRKQH